jgi:putative thioredoxin
VRRDREWNDQAARKQLLKLFEALGPSHPLAAAGRRRLSSLLFA